MNKIWIVQGLIRMQVSSFGVYHDYLVRIAEGKSRPERVRAPCGPHTLSPPQILCISAFLFPHLFEGEKYFFEKSGIFRIYYNDNKFVCSKSPSFWDSLVPLGFSALVLSDLWVCLWVHLVYLLDKHLVAIHVKSKCISVTQIDTIQQDLWDVDTYRLASEMSLLSYVLRTKYRNIAYL